jgi:hypothetical protein
VLLRSQIISTLHGRLNNLTKFFLDSFFFAASASVDNLRLWNVTEAAEPDASGKVRSGAQFKIIPGHHGGYISQLREIGSLPVSAF